MIELGPKTPREGPALIAITCAPSCVWKNEMTLRAPILLHGLMSRVDRGERKRVGRGISVHQMQTSCQFEFPQPKSMTRGRDQGEWRAL